LDDLPSPSRSALRWSQWDGILFSVMDGLAGGASPALPLFALALGMPPLTIGMLATLPILAGSLAQGLSPALERLCRSRKRAVILGCLVQALSWLGIPAVAGLPPGLGRQALLVGIVSAGTVGQFVTIPSWGSWMGDLIPPALRSRVFAWRAMPAYGVTALSLVGMGLWMQAHERSASQTLIGAFQILFLAAAAARLLSLGCLLMQHEPPMGTSDTPEIREGSQAGFTQVMLFFGFFHLVLYLSAPYFVPYMRLLDLSYLKISVILAITWPAKMLFLPAWQRAASRYGNRRVVLISAALTAILPCLWMLSADGHYLLGVMVLNGMIWAGIELCELPYLLDITTPAERTRKLAGYFSFRSLCGCLGAVAGDGAMRGYQRMVPGPGLGLYHGIFLLSGLGRVAAVLWAWRRLPEPHPDPAKGRTGRILAEVLLRR
jgi:MFS family permease